MKYADLLKEYGVTPEQTTKKIQKSIKELADVVKAVEMAKEQLGDGTLGATKRRALEISVKEAEAAIPQMDEELHSQIEKWYPKREATAERIQRMQAGRKVKTPAAAPTNHTKGQQAPAGGNTAANGSGKTAAPAAPAAPAQPAGAGNKGGNPAPDKTEKKKGWGLGWVLGGVIVLVGALVGVNMANKSK